VDLLKEPKSRKPSFKWTPALFIRTERSSTSTRSAILILNESSDLVEFVGTAMHVTERKRAEEALRQAQADLAYMSRVTTMAS